ncbi:MAG: hypothetical protein R3344_12430, partial [Acidobacteriota bacterium]|nr:hypothetical protein [Acidobacteriota bacterium]
EEDLPEVVDLTTNFTDVIDRLAGNTGGQRSGFEALAVAMAKAGAEYATIVPAMLRDRELLELVTDTLDRNLTSFFENLATGALEGKDAFKEFTRSLLADFARLASSSLSRSLLGGIFGLPAQAPPLFFASGGIAPGGISDAMPIKGYAGGGPVFRKPHVGVIGEGQFDEAVVPLPDGRSIPVSMRGGGGTTIIINAVDTQSFAQALARNPDAVTSIVAQRAQSNPSFGAAFGELGGGFSTI